MLDNKKNFLVTSLFILSAFAGCKKGNLPPSEINSIPKVSPSPITSPETGKEKKMYVYNGDKFKDPFIPAGISSNYQPDAVFDPKRAQLKALIYGPQLKSALIMVGGTVSYFVKGDQMFDVMGKIIQGYVPKVYENKVLIYGEGDTMFEYTIKKNAKGDN